MSDERPPGKPRRFNPAIAAGVAFALMVGLWVANAEFGPLYTPPERRIDFAHPLSTQLDTMMRSNAEVLVIGDPDFVRGMRARERDLGGSVQYMELAQVDLYAIVEIFPAVLRSKSVMFVMESIPAYWAGQVHMAVQPPEAPVLAAVQQVREVEPTPVQTPPPAGRAYIVSPPAQPFNYAEAMKLVFDNYNGYWREVDDCLLWVTNDDLLAVASPEFQAAYKAKFADPAEMHVNVGHVGGVEHAPALLEACRARAREAEAGGG